MTADHLCAKCKTEGRDEHSIYCRTCVDNAAAKRRSEQQRQWASIARTRHRMEDWTLETFPAADHAGRDALKAVEPWLWAHAHHRLVDQTPVAIHDDDPYPEDAAIWEWHHGEHFGLNLYLWGPVGSGKSGLAWALLRARVELTYDYETPNQYPAWANVIELLDKAKASMSAGDPASPIRDLYEASVLVLDDLGAERPTDWARDAIAALVQHRHTRELPTIVTSNYAPSALAKRLGHDDLMIGQRIVSRLTEDCIKHKLDRADLRLRNAA